MAAGCRRIGAMDTTVINIECVIVTVLAVGLGLTLLVRLLMRRRPDMAIARPLAVGYALRLIVIAVIPATGLAKSLRGSDELIFMHQAHQLAAMPWGSSAWLPTSHSSFLHIILFAAQLKLFDSPDSALRVTQVGIAMAGVVLLVASVYDLAGARPARLAAWLLSLEVTSLFFNQLLHKDPLLELSSGLMVFGGVKVWKRLDPAGILLMCVGALIALGTRHYVGWFLFACTLLLTLHAAVRQSTTKLRAWPVIYGATAIIVITIPILLNASSPQNLKPLQHSQIANTTVYGGGGGHPGAKNLALEEVDFSTRSAIITNLPQRVRDVLLRPYPWQVGDTNQMLGVVGSLIALATFFLLIRYALASRGEVVRRTAPILYPFFFLMIAYALAVGNAGTGYRYRTHLVALALTALVVLRSVAQERAAAREQEMAVEPAKPSSLPAGPIPRRGVPAF
jgi:hypothetical protein